MSLRVLILNYEFPPMGGGAGHASWELARQLAARGCAVDVVTSGIAGQPAVGWVEGFRVYRVKSARRSIQDCGFTGAWSYVMAAQPVCRRLLREYRYSVIHYFFGLPTGALALCTPGADRIPSVVSLRGSDVPGYDTTNRLLGLAHGLLRPVTRRIWRRADAVVALSAALREQAKRTLPGRAMEVIPNGVDATRFTPGIANGRPSAAMVRLLTVARLIRRKGLDDLLRAMALLNDEPAHLTIQGSGADGAQLEKLAVSLGVQDRVSFSGFRVRERLPEIYQAADIFVMPSLSESFGLAVIEAMACGLPVVISQVGGMIEYVEDGVNGLIVPLRDPHALAQAIRRLIRDPSRRQAMGRRNAEKIRGSYTTGVVAEAYLATYERVIAARRHQQRGLR